MIVGVGLIGGSLGLALKAAGEDRKIIGVGPREETLAIARRRKAIDQGTTNLAEAVRDAEIIVVCTPVSLVAGIAIAAAEHCPADCIITDAGSTKGDVVAEIGSARAAGRFPRDVVFIGGHPIAGGEKTGPEAADAKLFDGRRVILTPTIGRRNAAVRAVWEMWSLTGADVTCMSPPAHDKLLAAASHLPHAVAVALSATLNKQERKHSAGGLADTTRVAAGDPALWRDIFRSNAAEVVAALERFQASLTELRESIARDDQRLLTSILTKAKKNRDAL